MQKRSSVSLRNYMYVSRFENQGIGAVACKCWAMAYLISPAPSKGLTLPFTSSAAGSALTFESSSANQLLVYGHFARSHTLLRAHQRTATSAAKTGSCRKLFINMWNRPFAKGYLCQRLPFTKGYLNNPSCFHHGSIKGSLMTRCRWVITALHERCS